MSAHPSVDDVLPLLKGAVDTRFNNLQQWVLNTYLRAQGSPHGHEALMMASFERILREMLPGRASVQFSRVDLAALQVYLREETDPIDAVSQLSLARPYVRDLCWSKRISCGVLR